MYKLLSDTFNGRRTGGRRALWFIALWGLLVAAAGAQTRYYVTPDGTTAPQVENAWSGPFYTLQNALDMAVPGDEIWVQGLETGAVYTVPAKDTPFTLKAGVRLYGGFRGNETRVDERATQGKAYDFTYRSVLSADLNGDDRIDPTSLIYTGNDSRKDNAVRVLVVSVDCASADNKNRDRSVVDGFTVRGGHAEGADGGGILVKGGEYACAYTLSRLFFFNNYASRGGAVFVDEAANEATNTSLVDRCVVYNNAAGQRGVLANAGGGLWIDGAGVVVNTSVFNNENGGIRIAPSARVVNSTVTRNTVAGIDLTHADQGDYHVLNTVIWGNTALYDEFAPRFKSSSYHEVTVEGGTDTDGNVYVSDKNNDQSQASPFFATPSLKTSFDRDFNWQSNAYPLWSWDVLEGSAFIGHGINEAYNEYGKTDLGQHVRISGEVIDIGAYEFQDMPADRVLRVKAGNQAVGADGLTWETAYPDIQTAINRLASSGMPGEVWVAAGEYAPTELMENGKQHTAAFIMKDGISVYGGFAGTESSKAERQKGGMPWQYKNVTVLKGSGYESEDESGKRGCEWSDTDYKWSVSSNSNHVVWFAQKDKGAFSRMTVLDGVTIKGGSAKTIHAADYDGHKGAGVYMAGNTYLNNCVVTENTAEGDGGAVYLKGGRVVGSLVFNNNADGNGGGVYMDNAGIVLRSMLANNSADDGAGVYMDSHEALSNGLHPEYLILSTSVVSNNTIRRNGAVYCHRGGVILQTTMTNNLAPNGADASASRTSRTGGLYVDGYALVVNSVLWNNLIAGVNVPMYADNPSVDKVRFFYTAVSGMGNAVWNNTLQQNLVSLTEDNSRPEESIISPDFKEDGRPGKAGVQGEWISVDYYWEPETGSNLRARGLTLGQFPEEVLLNPELDLRGTLFAQKPSIGAVAVKATELKPEEEGNVIRLYVDVECTTPEHDGHSWEAAYRSFNEAIAYFAAYPEAQAQGKTFEICIAEGDCYPRYAFTNLDPKTATVNVQKMPGNAKLVIKGGFQRTGGRERDPLMFRTWINGNHDGSGLEDGNYHCITVAAGANVEFDGLHITGGYAAGESTNTSGAGMLVGAGATVTVKNSIFENNTAANGAAIAASGAKVTLENCVVNNNTNTVDANPVIWCDNLTMHHVTVVNNKGVAPASMGNSSFSAGNTGGNTFNGASSGVEGAKNFANPTNKVGATMGYDTYLGGYSNFLPNTSSSVAGELINKATGTPSDLATDIAGNARSLGGTPDKGAYEAKLPENGTVFYVTAKGAGKKDGSSWENAIAGNEIYDLTGSGTLGIATTDPRYIGFHDAETRPYGETSGASKLFFEHLNESNLNASNVNYKTENHDDVTHVTGASGINIRNRRNERYVGGLQYAVERAAASAAGGKRVQVWVAGGTYTDYKGFVIRDKVEVLGGFPASGTPGLDDRHPLLSQYIPANQESEGLDKSQYETILQIQEANPINNSGSLPGSTRKPVLFQPDVCLPTKSPSGRESSFECWTYHRWGGWNKKNNVTVPGAGDSYNWLGQHSTDDTNANTYRWNLSTEQQNGVYEEYTGATWDGFTIRHGFYKDYQANRDGGAGVRMFRGVTLQNCVVTENYNSSGCTRGAGIYCDGENSKVVNCFILNNHNEGGESYGGGMYMILGTGYNNLVANNYAQTNGGGIFIEAATFYNNTVAYNRSNGTGGIHQYFSNSYGNANLRMYNCLLYGNQNAALGFVDVSKFIGAYNCYVQSALSLGGNITGKLHNSYFGTSADANPFERGNNALAENNFRLNATTICLNHGTDDLGDQIFLPATDVDFTDRIKDCTVDIGAYERNNEDAVKSDAQGVFYVTFNGKGTAVGDSPENAACAMKLQDVLDAAGRLAETRDGVTVKIAGYDDADIIYHANTLADPLDPQSYTFVIPAGVTVKGGYWEGTSTEKGNWDEVSPRDVTRYMTVLSAVVEATGTRQEVNGYHAVQFGTAGTAALDKPAVLDGVYLEDGKAVSTIGNGDPRTRGGGAIVPGNAHVRNCMVRNNTATQGGGLFVLPGGRVSGCVVTENAAEEGAGIYVSADGKDMSEAGSRSYILSCTVGGNTATGKGGGVLMERGAALVANTVVWGNTASSDKNVSGITLETYPDEVFGRIDAEVQEFYPFNSCFVETYEMPSNYMNYSMTTERERYFKNDSYIPRAFSGLIRHGAFVKFQRAWEGELGVSAYDMQGNPRVETQEGGDAQIDAGAYAHPGGAMKMPDEEKDVVRRIFVSPAHNTDLVEGVDPEESYLLGRSFYTSLFHLGDALEYIRQVRELPFGRDIAFEIWLAEGTYKPQYTREGGADETAGEPSQRDNSYVIPDNVKLFGGFSGDEPYAYGKISLANESGVQFEDITDYKPEQVQAILDKREPGEFSGNGVKEPWDFAHQTILSGRVNVDEVARNVYHVVYSKAENDAADSKGVVLDGLTIMDGETASTLEGQSEVGRGGGIYTYGVDYTLNRCRLLNNKAVRGGALHALNADIVVSGSIFAGNGTVDNPHVGTGSTVDDIRGGAVYMASNQEKAASFKAVNTLWVNNEASGVQDGKLSMGGALATSGESVTVNLMNNTFARNKAGRYAAVYVPGGILANTAVWGNEGEGAPVMAATMEHSASDVEVPGMTLTMLNPQNNHIDGPRFTRPSTVAGVEGYVSDARWNPGSISVLVDAGNGELSVGGMESGAYSEWMQENKGAYQGYMAGQKRYAGPKDENGQELAKTIDIGVYEYQYPANLYELDAVYVAMEESGDRSGDSWQNATSDLRGALNAMANSTGSQVTPQVTHKKVFIKTGEYNIKNNLYTDNVAYQINMGTADGIVTDTLTVKGSYNDAGKQDFSQPTVISAKDGNTILLDVMTQGKPVTVEGLAFQSGRTGIRAQATGEGRLTLKNVASRANATGIDLTDGDGEVLVANALLADGATGLKATEVTTVVNATFAQNTVAAVEGTPTVYNSVAWKSGSGLDSLAGEGNVSLGKAENSDIERGPNFVAPDYTEVLQRDYRIRPNLTLLDKGNAVVYQREVLGDVTQPIPDTESDLAGSRRKVGTGIDVGAYEYASELKPVIYVKAGVAGGDQSGSDWANAMGDLQGAADLATVYAQMNPGTHGYVFVHGNVTGLPLRLTRGNVNVYGGMADETGDTPEAVLAARKGLLEASARSSLSSLAVAGASVVDGFGLAGESNCISGGGMLSTSILTLGSRLDLMSDGILYNSMVDGATVSGQGKAVNVTAVNDGMLDNAAKENTVEAGQMNGYVTDGYWAYQLKETDNANIDGGKTVVDGYIKMAGHGNDLAGNQRVRGTAVDNGCFETWNVMGYADVTDEDYPHGKSVVYVREGGELRLKRNYASVAPFNPGFLLLEHGAGLWGGGKKVGLTHFAAERQLTVANGYKDLVAMPFRVGRMTVNGNEEGLVKMFRYDGKKRAGHEYTFDESDSEAWTEILQGGLETLTEGLLFEAPDGQAEDMTLRFYGAEYGEDGNPKCVELKQYNFNAPWNSPEEPGEKFTHKENMGWNLFGSPYLRTMNYKDMEYGRMLYGYSNNGYYTTQSWNENGSVQGCIPVGSAVFTQTATLKETETFTVGMRKEDIDYNTRSTKLALYVASAAGKRGLEENGGIYDELQLTAVPSEEASTEFDMAHDGVKWMNDNGEPEIFAVRDGGRYSLLSAIDREGTIGVGVSLPEAGMYSIGIPEDCEAEDYEYVMLKDAATGKAADLKEGAYSFRTAEAGVAEGRFTLSFKRMDADQRHAIYVKSGMGKATVFGVNDGDVVTVVTVDGKAVVVEEAVGSEVTFALAKGAYLFKVAGADGRTTVVKAMVR